jgi:hypothetical protein
MLSRRRIPLLVAFPAIYVGIAAVRAEETHASTWLLIAVAVMVALIGGRVAEGTEPAGVRIRLFVATGLSTTIAAAAFASRPGWIAIARELGAWFAMIAALRSIGAIDGEVGLASRASEAAAPPGFSPKNIVGSGIGIVSLVWGVAALVDAIAWSQRASEESSAPVVAAAAGAIALFAVGATALLVGKVRRLELTVLPRALACAGATGAGLILAVTFALSGVMPADAAAALGGAVGAALVLRVANEGDALALARNGRRTLTLVLFGGPVAALAAIAVEGRMHNAGAVALVLAAVALVVGALASKLEEPFLPVKGILIEALADAREAARAREAREAMAHAMVRLREASAVGMGPTAAPSPELWLLHPTRVLTVNAAGYLQERRAELPVGLFDVALGEPYATLRTSVLRALEVRRADLRPLLAWLDQRDALFATVIAESDDPEGLIIVPNGARTEELTLEETRAAKTLADTFVAVSQATSAKVRHLDRERELKSRIDALDDDAARLRHALELEANRHALATARLARPATVGIYSAASRMAFDALERRIAQDAPMVLVLRAGIDPVPYVARGHLSGPRKSGPLVVVDGTSSREHDLERWTDERTSPLALADRGVLMLVDGPALPRDVQVLVARAVAERRPPWERGTPLDVGLVLSITFASHLSPHSSHGSGDHRTITLEDLIADGRLAPELAARFESSEPIVLPGLHERPEDLRSIVADRLAREGLRVIGRPIGIDAGAFVRLVEYGFDGEDAELASITTKLVARVVKYGEDVVRAGDVESLALPAHPDEPDESAASAGPRPLSKPSQRQG